ncbi:Gfo/Idh/MocA family protein [Paenibacillus thermotolerans]|uniref:Gfo/Idh/MocA family protein n=1 Tax=Paenibacillus thermotolerans TaxID=3027807 RepID=UPI002367DB6F|nr:MULTISPECIES: Gfo/Idh/MocA family oxidoreductase [unclassified Paenibacillus]
MIGYGVIGCGRIADRHISSIAKLSEGRIFALCDIRAERMEQVEQEYRKISGSAQKIAHYQDIAGILADERVQAVVIATHSAMHAEIAKAALERGKHVMVEKPLALSAEEAENLVRLAESSGLQLQVCHQLRYKPVMRRIKEIIESGAMGKVHLGVASMRLQRNEAYYEAARWRGTWDQDGGMLLNQGIHLVDLLGWFLGEYESVYGILTRGPLPKQTEDFAVGLIRFKNGAVGMIEANTLTYPNSMDNSIALFGEQGTVWISGINLNTVRRWSFSDSSITCPDMDGIDEHFVMHEKFLQAIKGIQSGIVNGREGKKALELVFALYDSFRTNQVTKGPITTFSTTMMSDLEGW